VDEDIRAAVDLLMAKCPELENVVLWGLCDGASAALMHAPSDPRVSGVVAVNPWVRSEATLAQARVSHYYHRRLFDRELWRKLRSGEFAWRRSLGDLAATVWRVLRARFSMKRRAAAEAPASFQQRMAIGWKHLAGKVLFVLSGNDITAAEFLHYARNESSWQPFPQGDADMLRFIDDADHTFSRAAWNTRLIEHTVQWLNTQAAPRPHQSSVCQIGAQSDLA
jgi:exosortase A-associated hydrolase 1